MLWIVNLLICWLGFQGARRVRSLLIIFWLYGLYIGFIGFIKFTLGIIPINNNNASPDLLHLMFYVGSNALFLLACQLFWISTRLDSRLKINDSATYSKVILAGYAVTYFSGILLYFKDAIQLSYESFVNYENSAWGQVLFYAGASLISIMAATHRVRIAVFLSIPYFLLSVALGIRSFLALSIFPILIIIAYKIGQESINDDNNSLNAASARFDPNNIRKRLGSIRMNSSLAAIAVTVILAFAMFGATISKLGKITLPEDSLIEYYFIVSDSVDRGSGKYTGTESIERFFWGLASPILKQFGIRYEKYDDPQSVFATYIDDYAGRLDQYFHYPSLWQADTFAAFGYGGIFLSLFWAIILLSLERLISRSRITWVIFLPVGCWTVFTFARGAVGNSTISVSYVILLQVIVAFLIFVATKCSLKTKTTRWYKL